MKLEICANSYQSAVNAQKAGADRIELCSELSLGGLTPSYGLLKKVAKEITIPVNILIRPRSGHFCYSDEEFEIMKSDIELCKKLGFNGIVSGVLNADYSIDLSRTKELVALSKPMTFTFHRAFDCVSEPKVALQQLLDMDVETILSSGLQEKAEDGIDLLKELQDVAKNKLVFLVGGGINPKNVGIFKAAGFKEIHTSASVIISEEKSVFFGNVNQTTSNIDTIKNILKTIKSA